MQILRLKKHPLIIKKNTFETKEAYTYAEEAKDSIAKFQLKAEQANAILKKHNKATKKAKLLDFFLSELAHHQVSKTGNLKLNLEISNKKDHESNVENITRTLSL